MRRRRSAADDRADEILWHDGELNNADAVIRIPLCLPVFSDEISATDTPEKRVFLFNNRITYRRHLFLFHAKPHNRLSDFLCGIAAVILFPVRLTKILPQMIMKLLVVSG